MFKIQDIGEQLVINKPEDPVLFLKNYFYQLYRNRDALRIVLLTPPHVGKTIVSYVKIVKFGLKAMPEHEG